MSMRNRYQTLLSQIIQQPELHARWLNTLSLMEHIGSRKIIKALDSNILTEELLRHIAEETRHAFFFKRLCNRVLPNGCPTFEEEHLLCGRESKDYFKQLDAAVENHLQHAAANIPAHQRTMLNYLGVTLIIEVRANELYATYDELLRESGSELSLRSVIAEEARHLEEVTALLRANGVGEAFIAALWNLEHPLFDAWLSALHAQAETFTPRRLHPREAMLQEETLPTPHSGASL